MMGAVWLHDLPDWLDAAGLDVTCWPGWETRSRSSGGYDMIRAIGVHHDGGRDDHAGCRWHWESSPVRPVGALHLSRDGSVVVGAAGATNTQGKGGPWTGSLGTTGRDRANREWLSIEAGNRGDGSEPWPDVQQDAFIAVCAVLCERLGLDPRSDVQAHFEWAPGRKIDPAGPSRWSPAGGMFDMTAFRADVAAYRHPTRPDPEDPDDMTDAQLKALTDRLDKIVADTNLLEIRVGHMVNKQIGVLSNQLSSIWRELGGQSDDIASIAEQMTAADES